MSLQVINSQIRAMLDNIILPKLGAKKVDAIGRRDVEAIQVAMKDRPYQANRVLSLLSKMFNLAVEWKWRPDNPAKSVERYQEQKRERWLSDEELRHLCAVLDEHLNARAANAVRLQLLTDARLGEVLTSRKEDFDLHRGIWTKPSHQIKQKRTEHLPLSSQALSRQQAWSAAERDQEILERRNAKGGDCELSQARQPTHLCVPSRFQRAQPRDRRAIAGAHDNDNDQALRSSRGRSFACRRQQVWIEDCRFPPMTIERDKSRHRFAGAIFLITRHQPRDLSRSAKCVSRTSAIR
jgi:integrase